MSRPDTTLNGEPRSEVHDLADRSGAEQKPQWQRSAGKRWKPLCAHVDQVSTDNQADHGVSLEVQEAKIRAMAVVQGAEIAELIVACGESAKNLDRPGMVRLRALVEERKVDTVIYRQARRLTRSVKDLAELLERCQKRALSLSRLAESLYTGSAAGRLVINIMTAVSQWAREPVGERTRDGKPPAIERRARPEHRLRIPARDKRQNIWNLQEQAVLTAIRELPARRTLRGIAAELNACGQRTRRTSAWRLEHVAQIVGRCKYTAH